MHIQVSNGEILDKITILKIKTERITDAEKLANIKKELTYLEKESEHLTTQISSDLYHSLYEVNLRLWDIEDQIRLKEQKNIFDNEFIELARLVYITNDERSRIKKKINEITESEFKEEKSYESY